YTGTWRRAFSGIYWGGGVRYARIAGAKATLVFTGRSVALVSRIGPTRGKVKVYLDGTRVATIDLYSAGYHAQRVVWTRTFSASGRHRLSLVVSGTTTRPRVDLDGIIVGG
ncbi:MAG: N-acetylmuramoyl-L-alanine amidase, partial [Chloroflexota bacterium]